MKRIIGMKDKNFMIGDKMKNLIKEIKELNVEIKIALTIFLGGIFSMPIQYLRGVFGLSTMYIKMIAFIILMFFFH
ncbi:hypothetical protein CN692_10895 [Bacillus sp. AFS002410]|nr:hypothetical protein CN692_10895 [Bacillus sp. AFS002410]